MNRTAFFGSIAALAALPLSTAANTVPRSGETRELCCDTLESDGRRA